MTEAEWLACTQFSGLWIPLVKKASKRQRRLFWCAGARRHERYLTDRHLRDALEVAERFADGAASKEELQAAHAAARATEPDSSPRTRQARAREFARVQVEASCMSDSSMGSGWRDSYHDRGKDYDPGPEGWARLELLRDIIGNPFRTVRLDPAWLSWADGTVGRLARAIYDERAFDRMPILADALEDAGCTNVDILGHCRGPGPHVRGCWVVDLLAREQRR